MRKPASWRIFAARFSYPQSPRKVGRGGKISLPPNLYLPALPRPMTSFIDALTRLHPLSPALRAAVLAAPRREQLPARHVLLRPGQVARRVYFLETGLVRGYSLLHGREISS